METDSSTPRLFAYPLAVHERRHGPLGYLDYGDYKPWLRDEFQFRCVYCLCRERWFPDGDEAFSVDHLQPQSVASVLVCNYDNLVYACCHCNSAKRNVTDIADPCRRPFGEHLEVLDDGTIRGLTFVGRDLIHICQLDRPRLIEFRRRMLTLSRVLLNLHVAEAVELRRKYFGYPGNLPRLSTLRPPSGNTRPTGLNDCCFERRRVGTLSEFY
jgi:hypothetical protein